jgi:uncharacterized protein (TIGR02270 family)
MKPDTAADSSLQDEPLWDVLEEHLDEAEFCLSELRQSLDHPLMGLSALAASVDPRLDAHLDGLLIGGAVAAERLLVPQLTAATETELDRVAVVTIALLAGPHARAVGAGLFHGLAGVRDAAARGCALLPSSRLEAWAIDRFRETKEPANRAALIGIVGELLEPDTLLACLQSEDDSLAAATARVVSRGERRLFGPTLEKFMSHRDASVRESALVASLAWGSPSAWSKCERLALDPARDSLFATRLYGALGGSTAHARLAKLLDNPVRRASAVSALGYAGNPRYVPELLEILGGSDALEAKRAAISVALITGLDLADDAYGVPVVATEPQSVLAPLAVIPESPDDILEAEAALPPLEDDDLNASLVPPVEDAVPQPEPKAIQKFWAAVGANFVEKQRYLCGKPARVPLDWLDALETAPLGARHVLAIALGIRTGGKAWVDTRLRCAQQRQRIAMLRALDLRAFERFYDR